MQEITCDKRVDDIYIQREFDTAGEEPLGPGKDSIATDKMLNKPAVLEKRARLEELHSEF